MMKNKLKNFLRDLKTNEFVIFTHTFKRASLECVEVLEIDIRAIEIAGYIVLEATDIISNDDGRH